MAKIILTGDWHLGRDNDSRRHNENMDEFVSFMLAYAHENDIDAILQTGDWFDNRSRISVDTLNCGINIAKRLQTEFDGPVTVLTGNHDIYYKNRIDISSVNALRKHVAVVDEVMSTTIGGKRFLLVPWLTTPEEWEYVVSQTSSGEVDYVIGHFEFKNFMMNENYVMEHGFSHRELRDAKRVITGHYHMRQIKDNVIYVGSPFPFDYNDANDDERGFMVLDTDTDEVEFVDWGKVRILSVEYDEFKRLQEAGELDENTSVRINIPDDATEEMIQEATDAVSELEGTNSKINYKGNKARELIESEVVVEEVDNVDQSIIESIRSIDEMPVDIDSELLVSIFKQGVELDENHS